MSKPIDQERDLFNAHLNEVVETKQHGTLTIKLQRHDEYTLRDEQVAWAAWQARAAVQPADGSVPKADIVAWLNTATGDTTTHEVVVMDWDDENEPVQSLMTVEQHSQIVAAMLAAAPHPVSGEQNAPAIDYQRKFECLVEHAKRQDKVIAEMRYDENIRRFYDDGAVWFWAGDGTDNLETLACPVVINAGDLRALIAPAAQDVAGLAAFALDLIDGALKGGSFDGGDIQELAEKNGLLISSQREESCGDHCGCAEHGFPIECYRVAPALAARRAQQGDQHEP